MIQNNNPKVFSYDYYERLYTIEETHWWSKGIRDVCKEVIRSTGRFNQTSTVIDIGCGTGISLPWLKGAHLAGSVVQTDISTLAVQFCKKRGHNKALPASSSALPFKDNRFDLALSLDVLQHIHKSDLEYSIKEAFRILKPGGSLFVRTNVFRHGHHTSDTTTYRRFKKEELIRLVECAGFSVERTTYANAISAMLSCIPLFAIKKRIPGETDHNDQGIHLTLPERMQLKDLIQSLLFRIEASLVPLIDIPCGHSLILLARKEH